MKRAPPIERGQLMLRISPPVLPQLCPKGIDVYFENVGGAVFEAVFQLLNPLARIPCGLISMYNATSFAWPDSAAALDAGNPDQAIDVSRLHRFRLCRAPWRFHARCLNRPGFAGGSNS